MRSHAEAQLAHDGTLGAITELVFDDSTREGNRTGDPAILVMPLYAISDLGLERVDPAWLIDIGERHPVANDGSVPDTWSGERQQPRSSVATCATQEESETPSAPGQ